MPIPKPTPDEKKKDYISRCISFVKEEDPETPNDQAVAICETTWKNENKTQMNEWINGLKLSEGFEPKEEIMLFPVGKFHHEEYGDLDFNEDFHRQVIENYQKNVLQIDPFMDEEHKMGEALAYFDTSPYFRQNVGTFIKPNWTPLGKKRLEDGAYKYFSPWFEDFVDPSSKRKYNNVFRGGAATNIPFLKMMPAIIDDKKELNEVNNSVSVKLTEIYSNDKIDSKSVEVKTDEAEEQKSRTIKADENIQEDSMNKEFKDKLIKLFKLDENASDEDVQKAVDEAEKKENEEVISGEVKEEENKEETNEDDEEKKELSDKLNKLQKQLTETKANEIITKALSEGKITPKKKDFWLSEYMKNPESTENIIANMEKVISLNEKGISTEDVSSVENGKLKIMNEAEKLFSEGKFKNLSSAIKHVMKSNTDARKEYEKKCLSDTKFYRFL